MSADRVIEAGGVTARLLLGDCRERMREIPDASVDCVVCDPPYPCIKRSYGYWTEAEWHDLMRAVVGECRRILKPRGSAVFILQPNQRGLGEMRLWVWEFLVWVGRGWNVVQDIYWWNYTAWPTAPAIQGRLTRSSLKYCVWIGPPECHRDQDSVLWEESRHTTARRLAARAGKCLHKKRCPSGYNVDDVRAYAAAERRGGVIPFNVLPINNADPYTSAGADGHGAGTPFDLCDWWVRYISPPDGIVCDPFVGSGTTGLAALALRRHFVGIESDPGYFAVACDRLSGPPLPLFDRPSPAVPDDLPLFREAAPAGDRS